MGCEWAEPVPYDDAYWGKYLEMDRTQTGRDLTQFRIDWVKAYYQGGDIIDVGIGGGRFVREMNCYGFDINPLAIEWLKLCGRFRAIDETAEALTFWDSLEHCIDPAEVLGLARKWAFVSLPIFDGGDSITASRHYRPGEHFWYWTHKGFIMFVESCGFEVVAYSGGESSLGRDSIMSYALKRVD